MHPTGRRRLHGSITYIRRVFDEDPARAAAEILEAYERSAGRLKIAASELGLSRRHLQRYNWALDLWPKLDEIRERWRRGEADTYTKRLLRGESTRVDSGTPCHNPG